MSSEFLAVRLQFGLRLVASEPQRRRVAALLVDGALGPLSSMATRKRDKYGRHATAAVASVEAALASDKWDGLVFDNGKREPEAFAGIDNGVQGIGAEATQYQLVLAVPLGADVARQVSAVVEIAGVLDVAAGFVAVEPTLKDAQVTALGHGRIPKRPGLGETRRLERSGRDMRSRRLPTEIAGPEWGTFLGPGHLAKISATQLRDSVAFERVVEVSPRLVFLQVTADPRDDLSGKLEERLPAARDALRPLQLDLADVVVD